jgi:hypothetical protein
MPKFTEKQITNAYDRAAKVAWDVVNESQTDNFGADGLAMADERGSATCAAACAARAVKLLENGDYEGFLTNVRLAGQFANTASERYYARKVRA